MPFRKQHACLVNKNVVKITEIKTKESKWGAVRFLYGLTSSGQRALRGVRMPSEMPVAEAKRICSVCRGQFTPATLSRESFSKKEFLQLSLEGKREFVLSLWRFFKMGSGVKLAKWTTKYINDLPDSAFIYIAPGGKKDKEGKTVPRSLRHFPYKDHTGKIDRAHVQNALARINQAKIPASAKLKALRKLLRIAKRLGMKVKESSEYKLSMFEWYLEKIAKLENEKNS